MWVKLDWTLAEVHEYIVSKYIKITTEDELSYD